MAKTIRKITKEEEYEVCDLCGEEVNANNGNTVIFDKGTERERTYTVHWRGALYEDDTCVMKLVREAIEKKTKKGA
jgi:hypothetical protein